jgi:lysozyme
MRGFGMNKAADKIRFEEGFEPRPYRCTEDKLTIGIGFNLEAIEMPEHIAMMWLDHILDGIIREFEQDAWYRDLSENRQVVILDMAYQLGINGMLKFQKMINALRWERWDEAANELLDSKYAKQTPNRAHRNANILLTGEL